MGRSNCITVHTIKRSALEQRPGCAKRGILLVMVTMLFLELLKVKSAAAQFDIHGEFSELHETPERLDRAGCQFSEHIAASMSSVSELATRTEALGVRSCSANGVANTNAAAANDDVPRTGAPSDTLDSNSVALTERSPDNTRIAFIASKGDHFSAERNDDVNSRNALVQDKTPTNDIVEFSADAQSTHEPEHVSMDHAIAAECPAFPDVGFVTTEEGVRFQTLSRWHSKVFKACARISSEEHDELT